MSPPPAVPSFTPKQGQYLAFIYAYTRVLGRPPSEADLQRHFRVSPPSVHQMVLTLERAGLVRRQPGVARSIEVLVAPELLPVPTLIPSQRMKTAVKHAAGSTSPSATIWARSCRDWLTAQSAKPQS